MDFFAHGFWSFLIFHRYRWRWWALLCGMLPDLTSWFIFFWYNLFTHAVEWGGQHPPDLSGVPGWTWTLYNISHSLVVWFAVIIIAAMFFRRWPWPMFAGPIMIVFDLFTHTEDFLATPFLWPLSDFRFPGISWGSWWFMILNYSVLAIAYTYFFVYTPWKQCRFEHKPESCRERTEKKPKQPAARKRTGTRTRKKVKKK